MSKERIFAFNQSKKLSAEDLQDVSGAGMTVSGSASGTYNGHSDNWEADVIVDY